MYEFISILIVVASLLLILIVLVQESKGGGLASGFSSSNQVMGVRKTTDFLEKATWTLVGTVAVLSVVATFFVKDIQGTESSSGMQQVIENVKKEIPATGGGLDLTVPAAPAATTPAPQENGTPAQ